METIMYKKINLFLIMLVIAVLASGQMLSQMQTKPDEELTKEEAEKLIQDWQSKVNVLDDQLKNLDADIEFLKKEMDDTKKQLADCNDAIYKMLGLTPADVEAFKQQLGQLEGQVRDMKRLNDDMLAGKTDEIKALENELNLLRGNKASLIPEHYNKIVSLAREIRGLYREKKIKSYTVGTWAKDKDCLWNIAGKIDIYGDPFLWPKIWQFNTDEIRNPDIIFPGQVLQLPPAGPKTSDEMKAERKYWRMKRAAMEEQQPEAVKKPE